MDRPALPALLTGALSVLLVVHGCGAWPRAEPEEPAPDCAELPTASLPAPEELLDVVRLTSILRSLPDPPTELRITLAVREEGDEVRIYASDAAREGTLGLWPAAVREVLRSPRPSRAAPGVRLRLTTGSVGGIEVEAPTYCPARLLNLPEVTARFVETAGQMPAVSISVSVSESADIQEIRVSTQNGADDPEEAAWSAFHFARFHPAILDGRPVPATVQVRFPTTPDG